MFQRLKQVGPGAMVAAAFIGPGTVTTASIAGSSFGYTLLWAVAFSVITTLILQEMTARLGLVTQDGLGTALRRKLQNPVLRMLASVLVLGAIFVGNAAYEAGNITGAVLGLGTFPDWPVNPWVLIVGLAAFLLLWSGKYQVIERTLALLVMVMGLVFLVSCLLLKPSVPQIISGLFTPKLPDGSLVMVVSLIGTTVVPYNLFLHASAVKTRWSVADLAIARADTLISVIGGGVVTMAILIAAASAFQATDKEILNIQDLALQLKPLLGNWAAGFISLGFLAAGLSSAITAPLAASYATSEVLGWNTHLRATPFRLIWGLVLLTGIVLSSLGFKPTMVILFAQFANGLLLPLLAFFLVWIMNDKKIMGQYANNFKTNILGVLVIVLTVILGIRSLGWWLT